MKVLRKLSSRLGVSPEYLETGRELDETEQRVWFLFETGRRTEG